MGDYNDFIPRRVTDTLNKKPRDTAPSDTALNTLGLAIDQGSQPDANYGTEIANDVTDFNRNAGPGDDDVDGGISQSEFGVCGWLSLLLPFISLVSFLADIVTDVLLAIEYWRKEDYHYFYFTLAFLILPGFLLIFADLSWWFIDRSTQNGSDDPHVEGEEMTDLTAGRRPLPAAEPNERGSCSIVKSIGRFILGLLSLGIVIRIIQHMYYKYKKRTDQSNRDYYKQKVKSTKRDYAALNFICAFTETYSQAVLQLYIFAMNPTTLNSRIGRSIITSLIFMPLAYADHYRTTRAQPHAGREKKDMHFLVYIFYYLGVLGGMTFRMISMSMFIAALPLIVGVPLVNLHFLFVLIWIWLYHQPKFEGLLHTENPCLRKVGKFCYTALYSITCMLFYVNVYERDEKNYPSKWRLIGYNVVLYVESAVFIILGFLKTGVDVELYAMVLFVSALLHLIFIANYYRFLHPTIGICYTCADSGSEQHENVAQTLVNAGPVNNGSGE